MVVAGGKGSTLESCTIGDDVSGEMERGNLTRTYDDSGAAANRLRRIPARVVFGFLDRSTQGHVT